MRIKIRKAIVFDKFDDGWFPPIFSIVALVPDQFKIKTFYIFLAENMKKFSFTIDKFPEGGLYIEDIHDLNLIKQKNPHKFLHIKYFDKCIERIPWKKAN